MNQQTVEILLDLLIKKAVYGLTETEQRQLDELEATPAEKQDVSFELTASAISLVDLKTDEQLPAHLRKKIEAASVAFFDAQESEPAESQVVRPIVISEPKGSFWNWFGWAVAAAACVALAINIYSTRFPNQPGPTPELTLAEQRERLLASAGDAVTASWTDFDPKRPQNVQGDVVWSNSKQKGFIRFRGLPVNDKNRETYQLWIFDANQNAKTPIDGGVFDANESGEIIVPIDAKIRVQKPTMFAVTAEKPGGVVVSELGKVMAVAKV